MKFIFTILFIFFYIFFPLHTTASQKHLAGQILLQVDSVGEAWYVNPQTLERYYLGRPDDAFHLMRKLGIGIQNSDLEKIPVGLISELKNIPYQKLSRTEDLDQDGLSNALEDAIGTDRNHRDSDRDTYDDYTELTSKDHYDPLKAKAKIKIDADFTQKHLGKIFLQTEDEGQAWYLNPQDQKRYFLDRPADAFHVMRALGLGISNVDILNIVRYQKEARPQVPAVEPLENRARINLNIEFTSQAPFSDWGAPFDEACEETSMMMAANFFGLEENISDKNTARAQIMKLTQYVADFGFDIDIGIEKTKIILEKYYNLGSELLREYDFDTIKEALQNNYPIIIPLAGREIGNPFYTPPGPIYHMLLIKGYDGDDLITHDPGTRHGEDYVYNFDIIYNANHDWNGGRVLGGEKGILIVKSNS